MCYMTREDALSELARVAAEADRLRARASDSLREAVARAVERGLPQTQIARAIGRSQPEVSRLLRAHRATRFRPRSRLGRTLAARRERVLELAAKHKASNVRVFGSVVRGEDAPESDIDLLVDLAPDADLFDLASLGVELSRSLGRRVDVVPERMLRPRVAPRVLADAVAL